MQIEIGFGLMVGAAGIAGLMLGFRFSRSHGWRKKNPAHWVMHVSLAILAFAFYVGALSYQPAAAATIHGYSPVWYALLTLIFGSLTTLLTANIGSALFDAIRAAMKAESRT